MKPYILITVISILLVGILPTNAQNTDTLDIQGTLIQGTVEGDPLPDALTVQLQVFDANGELSQTYQTISTAAQEFEFLAIPRDPDSIYAFSATWAGIEQTSLPYKVTDLENSEIPIEFFLFDVTDNANDILGTIANLNISFNEVDELGARLVLELHYINLGDQIVYNPNGETLAVELPVAALGIALEDSASRDRFETVNRYNDAPIPAVLDTQPIVPRTNNALRVSFFVPYDNGAVIDMRFPVAFSGMELSVRQDGVVLQGEGLVIRDPIETSGGQVFDTYTLETPLNPETPLKFTMTGLAASSDRAAAQRLTLEQESETSASLLITIGLGALLVFGGVMAWLFSLRRSTDAS